MIKVSEIRLPVEHTADDLKKKIFKILNLRHINDMSDFSYKIIRRSIDARHKPEIFYTYSVAVELPKDVEKAVLSRKNIKNISKYDPVVYTPKRDVLNKPDKSPVIVGEGPAGLFAGLILAYAGFKPVIIERGDCVENRIDRVNKFWETGVLDKKTNVQYGEGGAGTFSDGKLNTGVKDSNGLNQYVLDTFVKFDASEECAYDSKPHVGTDKLSLIVKNIRNEIINLGGTVLHLTQLTDIVTEDNSVKSLIINVSRCDENCAGTIKSSQHDVLENALDGNIHILDSDDASIIKYKIDCDDVILAIGHSARDTFRMLYKNDITMQQKDFAVGLRIVHNQDYINKIQYGDTYKERYGDKLPPASYKLTNKTKDGRAVFSFCMCPGGYVVNASSEDGKLCVNGMSNMNRDSEYANSAIIVSVSAKDFADNAGSDIMYIDGAKINYNKRYTTSNDNDNTDYNVFAGMYFQEELERKAYIAGNGSIPVQKYGDFCNGSVSDNIDEAAHAFKGKLQPANLRDVLPEPICLSIIESMKKFGYTMKGFDDENAVFAGVESRTSSPVRILRDESFQSNIKGIYPCGEGAGYAGGIMSAAIDGIKVAEAVINKYNS